jgi:hypothetical protein
MKVTYKQNGYLCITDRSHPRATANGIIKVHILIAEKVLGKSLPKGVVVHHANGLEDNNALVICQDQEYHMLLEQRTRAYKACGHANWKNCYICKRYDDPANLYCPPGRNRSFRHTSCHAEKELKRKCSQVG